MDWIQWYTAILVVLGTLCAMFLDGRPKEGCYDFRIHVLGLLAMLPVYGRVMGWW